MTAVSVLLCCLCAFAFTEVTAWTIDLKEVREFYDDQNNKHESLENLSKNDYTSDEYGGLFEGRSGNYADGYAYGGYMEKKVHGIIQNGTKYLEGLKMAIENFKSTVENCNRVNVTRYPALLWNGTALEFFNSSWVQGLGSNPSWPDILNISSAMLRLNSTSIKPGVTEELDMMRCANATRDREKVRKLADLAMWTTRQIQDRVMAESYKGPEEEDIELLLRLAWFLEQLAHVTGFDPDATQFVNEVPTNREELTSTTPANPLILPVPEDVKLEMIRCLQENSSIPATERCAIPVDLPPLLRLVLNIPGPENNGSTSFNTLSDLSFNASGETLNANSKPQPFETLQTSENDQTLKLAPFSAVKSVRKRSADSPALNIMKYYVKHKVWDGSNKNANEKGTKNDFSINNDISVKKSIQKRSVNNYEIAKDTDYLNSRKSNRKRSIKYEKGLIVRQSEDPMQDISYYVKNKPGTNVRPSLAGVAEARLALERIFQTGNIEVVRRYGANYNPLIPSPFYFGVAKTMADI